uniref:F-box associated domain-containing protein n=1 Tax=Caenorhabditis japonica TaxID=281687 RepID=A0A8R1ESW1_CAEJA
MTLLHISLCSTNSKRKGVQLYKIRKNYELEIVLEEFNPQLRLHNLEEKTENCVWNIHAYTRNDRLEIRHESPETCSVFYKYGVKLLIDMLISLIPRLELTVNFDDNFTDITNFPIPHEKIHKVSKILVEKCFLSQKEIDHIHHNFPFLKSLSIESSLPHRPQFRKVSNLYINSQIPLDIFPSGIEDCEKVVIKKANSTFADFLKFLESWKSGNYQNLSSLVIWKCFGMKRDMMTWIRGGASWDPNSRSQYFVHSDEMIIDLSRGIDVKRESDEMLATRFQ